MVRVLIFRHNLFHKLVTCLLPANTAHDTVFTLFEIQYYEYRKEHNALQPNINSIMFYFDYVSSKHKSFIFYCTVELNNRHFFLLHKSNNALCQTNKNHILLLLQLTLHSTNRPLTLHLTHTQLKLTSQLNEQAHDHKTTSAHLKSILT